MSRFKAALLAFAVLASPAAAQAPLTVLRVVPQADVAVTDPLFTTAWISTIHGTMVWESLFAWDSQLQARPQMAREWSTSADGLTWRFTLRDGLKFHDGSPVTTEDVIASLRRWMGIDAMARKVAAVTTAMTVVDAKTFEWRLSAPVPGLLDTLAAAPSHFAVIMRARDIPEPGKPATSVIGSGPFRFNTDLRVSGARVVYDRNPDYVPRDEPPDGLAGGRVVKVDRVEFQVQPDQATAVSALQAGEVDILERPSFDLLPLLRGNRQVKLQVLTELASQAVLRPNALYPPFNDPRARLALSYIINQDDQMSAGYGDAAYFQACNSFFVCGSPNGTTAGAEDFGPNLARARQLLAEAGYKGEPIRMPATRDISYMGPMAEVASDAMRQAGLNVQVEWSDWASVVSRTTNQGAPDAGGWNIYVSGMPGVLAWTPSTNIFAAMPCDRSNLAGWPCDEEVEALRTRYANAPTAERPAILDALQRRLAVVNPYRLLGQATQPVAFRSNVAGLLNSPVIAYWNISKD
ncbi:ABC transporter substrate-binding protein [Roseomonas haemaphysalidis]|uniref:ABC transporter substrate-binding protein n=1 Tax=Roseomonas haemaphysalidis TaxID=2768162 RepID=A0ABS3KL94_9PROT|nr:ABC transporter substrate-binding protein [Roseomonas haemaphysalidis]MBO1078247.1 ABC transporter substrate-binding protein [Roseomonas haemaphysalidis]